MVEVAQNLRRHIVGIIKIRIFGQEEYSLARMSGQAMQRLHGSKALPTELVNFFIFGIGSLEIMMPAGQNPAISHTAAYNLLYKHTLRVERWVDDPTAMRRPMGVPAIWMKRYCNSIRESIDCNFVPM